MSYNIYVIAHGSWLMAHGSWLMAHGSWLKAQRFFNIGKYTLVAPLLVLAPPHLAGPYTLVRPVVSVSTSQ